MTTDDQHTTPLKAANLAYAMCAEQVLCDEQMALEFARVDKCSEREIAEFRTHLETVARRVRKMLNV
jgi:hypothetical protein